MASKFVDTIRKVNTLVNADLSSDDSDDECDNVKGRHKKKCLTSRRNKNNREKSPQRKTQTIKYDGRIKSENPFERKADEKYPEYFVSHLPNNYYHSQPVNNGEYVYDHYSNQRPDAPRAARLWNGNRHFENAALPRQNPHQPKYFPDFIINNPNLSEVPRCNGLESLPSAHHVAKDNDLSRYYSVLELPQAQKNHITFSPEPLKDNRYYISNAPVVSLPGPYVVRNKQQTYKPPPMEAPYENPNAQFRYENSARFDSQNGQPVEPNNLKLPPVGNNFPNQFNGRNLINNSNPQGMKSAYSVYVPGNLNSQSLNNVYVSPAMVYPVRTQNGRGVFSNNDNRRMMNLPNLPNIPIVADQYVGNNDDGTNENPNPIRNLPTRGSCRNSPSKSLPEGKPINIPPNTVTCPKSNCPSPRSGMLNESNGSCCNGPRKSLPEGKPIHSPPDTITRPKSNSPSPRFGQGPYEGNDLSMNKLQNKCNPKSECNCNVVKNPPNSTTLPEGWSDGNLTTITIDQVKLMFEALKKTLEKPQLQKQHAEVQNSQPEIAREDKTTHTQYVLEDKETQYGLMYAKESSQIFKEIGTQVKCVEQKPYTRKCQGVTALHSHFRSKSPIETKSRINTVNESKFYIDLGENNDLISDKRNKGYQEIVDIIKRENGKDNQEMADVIFNMIYGKNCHIVVQKGVACGEGKKSPTQKNVKKNQGISTTNVGLKKRPSWKDVWTKPSRDKITTKDNIWSSPLPSMIEHETFPKNELFTKPDSAKEKKTDDLKKLYNILETFRLPLRTEMNYFIRKQPDSQNNSIPANAVANILVNNTEKNVSNNKTKVSFAEPNDNGKICNEKDEIVVDIENEKILECILNNNNRPKGEIIIDVGCVQVPDDSVKSPTDQFNIKENLGAQESEKLSQFMSRTELYEEAILNLIAKQIKKCTSDWKFDVKDEDDDEVGEYKCGSPLCQTTSKRDSTPISEVSMGEKKNITVSPVQNENKSNNPELNMNVQEGVSPCGNQTDMKNENITNGDHELNEFYGNIKVLFNMLDDGEKYEFISDVIKKISNFYAKESQVSSPHSLRDQSLDMNDSIQGLANGEEIALAQVLRMICYENDTINVDSLISHQLAKTKQCQDGECTNSTNSKNTSNVDVSVRDEILSNYVLLDTPDMIINMGKRFVNKPKENFQAQPEPKTVSRGVSANL